VRTVTFELKFFLLFTAVIWSAAYFTGFIIADGDCPTSKTHSSLVVSESISTERLQFYPATEKLELTKAELDVPSLYTETTPTTILLHIVEPELMDTLCPGHNMSVYACTYSTAKPCEIFMPAYQPILFSPLSGRASWAGAIDSWDGGFANSLAHEILHCYIPNWHAGFTEQFEGPMQEIQTSPLTPK
jgi:hypothetical protein